MANVPSRQQFAYKNNTKITEQSVVPKSFFRVHSLHKKIKIFAFKSLTSTLDSLKQKDNGNKWQRAHGYFDFRFPSTQTQYIQLTRVKILGMDIHNAGLNYGGLFFSLMPSNLDICKKESP
jgi:hypothetical protein